MMLIVFCALNMKGHNFFLPEKDRKSTHRMKSCRFVRLSRMRNQFLVLCGIDSSWFFDWILAILSVTEVFGFHSELNSILCPMVRKWKVNKMEQWRVHLQLLVIPLRTNLVGFHLDLQDSSVLRFCLSELSDGSCHACSVFQTSLACKLTATVPVFVTSKRAPQWVTIFIHFKSTASYIGVISDS